MKMKTNAKRTSTAAAMLLLCLAAFAQTNTVTIPGKIEATAGSSVVLPVSVGNSAVITGLEFTLHLPQACTIEKATAASDRTYPTTSLRFDAGTGIVVLTDLDGLPAGNGELLSITIGVSDNAAAGEQEIALRDIKFVDQELKKTEIADQSAILDVTTIEVESIQLKETSLKMKVGQRATLEVVFTPAEAKDTRIKWTTSDPSVATVNNAGVATAVADGTAVITATTMAGGRTAQCQIQVSEVVSGYELSATVPDKVNIRQAFPLSISMRNQNELRAVSCDIELPEGTEPVVDERGAVQIALGERANSSIASLFSHYDADSRLLSVSLYASTEENILGTTGELFACSLSTTLNTPMGESAITVGNVKYTYFSNSGKQVSGVCDNLYATVNISDKGDANRDGRITLDDALLILRHIADAASAGDDMNKEAADMNDDGKITIVDATAIIKILM